MSFYAYIKARKKFQEKTSQIFLRSTNRMAEKPSLVEEFQSLLKIDETEKPSSLEEKESATHKKNFF